MVQEQKTRRERDEKERRVDAFVGVSQGRLCINISWYHLFGDDHWAFLEDMFAAAGWTAPKAIVFEKNKSREDGSMGVNWNELRISGEQCEMVETTPEKAADDIRGWLAGPVPRRKWKIKINVGESVQAEFDSD